MTVREMIGLNSDDMKAEMDAAISRVKKLNEDVAEMREDKADKTCQYFVEKEGDLQAECEQMNALYCKCGECPLRKELRYEKAAEA